MVKKESLLEWVKDQKDILDDLIGEAASRFYFEHCNQPNFLYDLKKAEEESLALSRGGDLCYDRPALPMSYSLWYHGKRMNSILKYAVQKAIDVQGFDQKIIKIFDLGAGTGAILWAVGLVFFGLKKLGGKVPQIQFVSIDISPLMLDYNLSYLWKAFQKRYDTREFLIAEFEVNSWINSNSSGFNEVWMFSSYLFDHSEDRTQLSEQFNSLIKNYRAQEVLLLSSYNKRSLTNTIADQLSLKEYNKKVIDVSPLMTGKMERVKAARKHIRVMLDSDVLINVPKWEEQYLYSINFSKNYDLGIAAEEVISYKTANQMENVNLFQPKLKVRNEVTLTEQQIKAAEVTKNPTYITGPAGSGKSVVITEKVLNYLKGQDEDFNIPYDKNLHILVSTFNKDLLHYLGDWIYSVTDPDKIERRGNLSFRIIGSDKPNILLKHFDVLPTHFANFGTRNDPLGYKKQLIMENDAKSLMSICVNQILDKEHLRFNELEIVKDPHYLLDEYHRVFYGLECKDTDHYLTIERRGRGNLGGGAQQRHFVSKVFEKFIKALDHRKANTIIGRRRRLWEHTQNGNLNNIFTHILVDEFQDCTYADLTIFYNMLRNDNKITLAGDLAQAVHLGGSARRPSFRSSRLEIGEQEKFVPKILEGSFRLPYYVSECIKGISEKIRDMQHEDCDIITPYKGAPPGVRPILVYEENTEKMAAKINDICIAYSPYLNNINSSQSICILEKDRDLASELNRHKVQSAETETILKIKGMEKNFVVWSTRINIPDKDEINNFVYTILTRTSGIVVIAIFSDIIEDYKKIIRQLRKDRVLTWDQESEQIFNNICKGL